MLCKTSELAGPALDYAVARALGKRPALFIFQKSGDLSPQHRYSRDWSQAGPIIELERIGLFFDKACGNRWRASHTTAAYQLHPSPLIAAMRCYVASKLGDEVEIPDELCKR